MKKSVSKKRLLALLLTAALLASFGACALADTIARTNDKTLDIGSKTLDIGGKTLDIGENSGDPTAPTGGTDSDSGAVTVTDPASETVYEVYVQKVEASEGEDGQQQFEFDYAAEENLISAAFNGSMLQRGVDYTVSVVDGKLVIEFTDAFLAKYKRDSFDVQVLFTDGKVMELAVVR